METLHQYIGQIRNFVWGPPFLILMFGTGIYFTFLLRGLQFRYLKFSVKEIFAGKPANAVGDISHFEALMTTLAGAIGTGSIVGVTTALAIGGLGSLFWMWVTAIFCMATKYAESLLAVKYREVDGRGEMIGGPMEYMEKGLGMKWMATVFAFFGTVTCFGTGNLVQVNSIADAVNSIWSFNPWYTGMIIAVLTASVLVGGVKGIGRLAGVLVPVMSLFYLLGGLLILATHYDQVPEAFRLIFEGAFVGQAAAGGFAGAAVMTAVQMGIARSVFSNESGLGISSIAAAAAQTDHPARQGMISMTGGLLSTMVVCTITGLAVAVTGVLGKVTSSGKMLNGAAMAIDAFRSGITGGEYIVSIGLILFAFSTIIAWAYYGEKCCEYLFGEKSILWYRALYIILIIPGAAIDLEIAWGFADITNGLMALPNLIAVIALSKVVVSETKSFLTKIEE